ncbi:MAG: hypothetical protein V2A71_04610 [Candidatus Eisenbacteria bacterium]
MQNQIDKTAALRLALGSRVQEPLLREYYVSFKNWVPFVESGGYGPLDGDGVPLVDYAGHARITGGRTVYFSVTVAQYALGLYELWLESGSERHRERFLTQVRWLESRAEEARSGVLVWPATFDFPVYGLRAPLKGGR